jgi:hypothetical protein
LYQNIHIFPEWNLSYNMSIMGIEQQPRPEEPVFNEELHEEDLERMSFEEDLEQLRETADPEKKKEIVNSLYDRISDMTQTQGLEMTPGNIWNAYGEQGLLIRRGRPEKDIWAVLHDEGITMHEGDALFPNAADDSREGLRIAMSEGQGGDALAVIYGFDPASVDVHNVIPTEHDPRDKERFKHVKSVRGSVPVNDLRYIIFRTPRHLFPEEKLLEDEEDKKFIFRSIDLSNAQQEEDKKAA